MLSRYCHLSLWFLLFTLAIPGLGFAQNEGGQEELPGIFGLSLDELLNLEVTAATRTPQSISKSLSSVSVITQADIRRLQPQTVPELLETVVGITISYNGAPGKRADMRIRGTESDHLLLYIDGIKVSSVSTGRAAVEHIPVNHIEYIEVVRGPRSSLYGSEALGGVINIVTRGPSKEFESFGKLGYGNHNTGDMHAGFSGSQNKTGFGVQVGRYQTDGIHVRQNSNPDLDGYEQWSLSGVLKQGFGKDSEVEFRFLRSQGDNQMDGGITSTDPLDDRLQDNVLQVASGKLRLHLSEDWELSALLGENRDDLESFTNGQSTGVFNSRRTQASLQSDRRLSENHLFTAGMDYVQDRVTGTTDFPQDERDTVGIFAQWQGTVGKHQFLAALRHDENDTVGDETTYNFQWGCQCKEDYQFSAAYGTAFKAPGFNDLFWPGFGNPILKPEKSETIEAEYKTFKHYNSNNPKVLNGYS